MSSLTRREFVRTSGATLSSLPLLSSCAEAVHSPAAMDGVAGAVEIRNDTIAIRLPLVPSLGTVGGSFVVYEASVIVVHATTGEYRAFSNVCTHAGCGISQFVAMRLRCPCHGSEFDLDGVNVYGPAPSPLARLAVSLEENGTLLRVARTRQA